MAKPRDLIIGLEIAERIKGPDYHIGGAGHDVIWLLHPGTELSDEDRGALVSAGWRYDEETGWQHYT